MKKNSTNVLTKAGREENRPKVGLGVVIVRDGKILMGKRKNAHGEGDWCYPGGHIEFGETWEQCAIREVAEETGIKIKNLRFGSLTNDIFENEDKHYITICMVCDYDSGKVAVMEPEKCERWEWFSWDKLPSPLFLPTINQLKAGFNPLNKSGKK